MTAAARPHASAVRELWQFRELWRGLVVRNLKVKYQHSLLGFVWTLLNPLLTVAVLVAVFTYVVRISMPAYWAFVLSGYFVWNFVQQMVSTGAYVLAEHAPLRRSAAFPSEVLVYAATTSRLVEFAVELALALVALTVFLHGGVPSSYVLLPVLLMTQALLAIGLTMPLACLSVFYRDVQHALPIALLILFYVSPVFYPASLVPEAVRSVYLLNPVAALLTAYQIVLYEGRWPSASLLLGAAAASIAIAALGHAVFNRYKRLFAELV